ncbi:MAG: CYTH domain-containing protein [Deltaproteobacteria bacterium]|jgi:adenylate cyclase|nr:CYTH domain-containing protein [Deltaproteobacteria bacterium]
MGREIERKFLLRDGIGSFVWKNLAERVLYCRQGYLSSAGGCVVRVRVAGGRAFLAVKGAGSGMVRDEYEYEIPLSDGEAMLETLAERPFIEKKRYFVPSDGLTWEIDEFMAENAGLVVAEVELASADQTFSRPFWIGEEVTGDARYYNAVLVRHPYARWAERP